MNTKLRGDLGEERAAEYLAAKGYHLVKRNLRCRSGEVDIVVYRDGSLVFVEVKHWLTIPLDNLSHSINAVKRSRILGCSREFVADHAEWLQCRLRFDVVHIGPEQITHFENAFTENGFQ